jgi:hypothetical protein
MRKFTASSFEIDLSNYQITENEENTWFTNKFFTKFTFPFNLPLNQNTIEIFNFINLTNLVSYETVFEGFYTSYNKRYTAKLVIEEIIDTVQCVLYYGFEDYPNYDKKLSELPLEIVDLQGVPLTTFALTHINSLWPNKNFNFPCVHTDKYDNENDWLEWGARYNRLENGAFVTNTFSNGLAYNRNIMLPVPYWLHIIKRGFEDAGLVVTGEVLTHPLFERLMVFSSNDNSFKKNQYTAIFIDLYSNETSVDTEIFDYLRFRTFNRTYNLPNKGIYKVSAQYKLKCAVGGQAYIRMYYRGQQIYDKTILYGFDGNIFFNGIIDFTFTTIQDLNPDELIITTFITVRPYDPPPTFQIISGEVLPLIVYDSTGQPVAQISYEDIIDLRKHVPDITFGQFMEANVQLFGLDITYNANEVKIGFKKLEEVTIVDMTEFEQKTPQRKFNKGNSYLYQYQEVNHETYKFLPVFYSRNEQSNSNFTKDEKTTEVTVNALPLPLLFRNAIQTAHDFESDNSKLNLILYDGMVSGQNKTADPSALMMPNIFEVYHKDFISKRIDAQVFVWKFTTEIEKIYYLYNNSRLYGYNQNHIVKTLQKTEIKPGIFTVEMESETY